MYTTIAESIRTTPNAVQGLFKSQNMFLPKYYDLRPTCSRAYTIIYLKNNLKTYCTQEN